MGTKVWGRITAAPHETLIHLRRGVVRASGPGLSIFAWPWDSWVAVPTSIQRVAFSADQVTAEKVGVEVRGVAVFRVADPLLAFRILDLEGPNSMQRIGSILQDMFVGAARRLVANMSIEACMTRRKEEIAVELIREIQPVVSGLGRPSDTTDRGWGLMIDTIEIQDVRILSEAVFHNLQAPYRASIEMQARRAEVERDREVHLREVDAHHATLEVDQRLAARAREVEEGARLASIAANESARVAQAESDARTASLDHALEAQLVAQRATIQRQTVAAELGVLDDSLEIQRRRAELDAEIARLVQEVENLVSDERIRYEYVREVLPSLAAAMATNLGNVQVTHVQSSDEGVGYLGGLLAQLGALAGAR